MRRLVFAMYGLVFVAEATQAAIVPLLPTFTRELRLSQIEAGAVLAAATFALVVVSVPVGLLADRVGARRLAIAAGGLVAAAAVGHALAVDFWSLVGARIVFGIGFGTIWTAGLATISGATSRRRAAAMGGTVTVGGAAHLAAPVSSGYLAEVFGVAVPFLALAALALALTVATAVATPARRSGTGYQPLASALRALRGRHRLQTAVATMALLGVLSGVVPLLVPLQLDANGLSAGSIGAVFSGASALWVAASALTARLGERPVGVGPAGMLALGLGAVFVLPLATLATAALSFLLLARAALQAPLSTIAYPLAESGGRIAGIAGGTAIGLVNLSWGVAAVAAPLAAGALAQTVGQRSAYGAVACLSLVVGLWILAGRRRANPAGG